MDALGEQFRDLDALASAIETGRTDHPTHRRYLGVTDGILAAIATGQLAPGDRLPNERLLAEICHTSRTSVRDALLVLEVSGVIEVRPGSGCYVTDLRSPTRRKSGISLDSVPRELLEARTLVEPAVARSSVGYLGADGIAQLRALIDECEEEGLRADPNDLSQWLRLSHDFHAALAAQCGNSILADFTVQLVDVTAHPLWQVVNALHVRDPAARTAQISEHREILDAIERGDGDAAADSMLRHLGALEVNIFGSKRIETDIRRQRPRTR
jgi:DNA-binding FadR family transcriptional regulator